MNKIDKKYLEADELIEYSEKQSLWGSLLPIAWFSLTIIGSAIIFIASYVGKNTFYSLGFIYLLIALPALWIILNNLKTVYAVTNKRVIVQCGIIKAKVSSATYNNIASLQILETALGKLFRFSTVIICISGLRRNNELHWKHTKSGLRVKGLMENHIGNKTVHGYE